MTGMEWDDKEERLFRFLRTTTIRDSIKKIRVFLLLKNCDDGRMLLAKKEVNGAYTLPYKEIEACQDCDIGDAIVGLCREKANIGVIEQLRYLGKLILRNGNGHQNDNKAAHGYARGLIFSACTRASDERQLVPNSAIWTTVENSKNYHTDEIVFEAVKREGEEGKK